MTTELLRKVDVPSGIHGDWQVQRYTITDAQACEKNDRSRKRDQRYLVPGTYTRLSCGGLLVMADVPAELEDLRKPINVAAGGEPGSINVLVTGLGLGVVVQAMLDIRSGSPESGDCSWSRVNHLTVIEKSAAVCTLVAEHYLNRYGQDRLLIINDDAFSWRPGRHARYAVVWHDIWSKQRHENAEESGILHAKYASHCDWQGSWCRETTETVR